MTQKLVEYYAGQALAGLVANPNYDPNVDAQANRLVKTAWAIATKMITEQNRLDL